MAAMNWSQRVEALYRADADGLWRALYAWSADADIANESVAEAYVATTPTYDVRVLPATMPGGSRSLTTHCPTGAATDASDGCIR